MPLVIFNAATSAIMEQSPYVVRTSFYDGADDDPARPGGGRARHQEGHHHRRFDYGPGIDAENAFKKAFGAAGGTVVESVRMPMQTNDFAPIMQRMKDSGADSLFAFLPSGPTTLGFVKAFNDNGLKAAGIKFIAPGDLTQGKRPAGPRQRRPRHRHRLPLRRVARQPGEQDVRRRRREGARQPGRVVVPGRRRL